MNGKNGGLAGKAVLRQQISRRIGSVGGQFTAPVGFDMCHSGGLRVISLRAAVCPTSVGKQSRSGSDAVRPSPLATRLALEALLPDRSVAAHPEHRLAQQEEESRKVQARRRRKQAARRLAVAQ